MCEECWGKSEPCELCRAAAIEERAREEEFWDEISAAPTVEGTARAASAAGAAGGGGMPPDRRG